LLAADAFGLRPQVRSSDRVSTVQIAGEDYGNVARHAGTGAEVGRLEL
jgi:hypothetical protein